MKYKAAGRFDQLEVCVVGCGLSDERLSVFDQTRDGSDGVNDLSGIVKDAANVYEYFREHGARIHTLSVKLPPEPGLVVKRHITNFLRQPGNAKLLYFSGHGRKTDGALVLGDEEYFTPQELVRHLSRSHFNGIITIVIDACFSGQWSSHLWRTLRAQPSRGLGACLPGAAAPAGPIVRAAESSGFNAFFNLRLAALASQDACDTPSGSSYTSAWLSRMRKEKPWTGQECMGWGTQVWAKRPPQEEECIWGTGKGEVQTDVAVDLVYDVNSHSWMRFYPPSRADFLDSEGYAAGCEEQREIALPLKRGAKA